MKRIFISDLHLDAGRADLTSAFISFLDTECEDADELYILGDFFELWLGDDDKSPLNQTVIGALSGVACNVFVMHGNRDFLIGEDFCKAANATLLQDPCQVEIAGTPVLLMHGDSLCTRDLEYMKARQQLRAPAFQADFLSKPLAEREIIANHIRGQSNDKSREKAEDIMDVTPEEVIREMNDHCCPVLIHGHTHRPGVHEVSLADGTGKRFVLGDWDTSMQYLEAIDSDLTLRHYKF